MILGFTRAYQMHSRVRATQEMIDEISKLEDSFFAIWMARIQERLHSALCPDDNLFFGNTMEKRAAGIMFYLTEFDTQHWVMRMPNGTVVKSRVFHGSETIQEASGEVRKELVLNNNEGSDPAADFPCPAAAILNDDHMYMCFDLLRTKKDAPDANSKAVNVQARLFYRQIDTGRKLDCEQIKTEASFALDLVYRLGWEDSEEREQTRVGRVLGVVDGS